MIVLMRPSNTILTLQGAGSCCSSSVKHAVTCDFTKWGPNDHKGATADRSPQLGDLQGVQRFKGRLLSYPDKARKTHSSSVPAECAVFKGHCTMVEKDRQVAQETAILLPQPPPAATSSFEIDTLDETQPATPLWAWALLAASVGLPLAGGEGGGGGTGGGAPPGRWRRCTGSSGNGILEGWCSKRAGVLPKWW